MGPDRFVRLALLGLGAIVAGFVVRGLSRIVVPVEVASALAAPLILGGFALVVVLTLVAALAYLGVGPLAGSLPRDND